MESDPAIDIDIIVLVWYCLELYGAERIVVWINHLVVVVFFMNFVYLYFLEIRPRSNDYFSNNVCPYIRVLPQGTVDNNLGPDRLVGPKALDPNYCRQPTLWLPYSKGVFLSKFSIFITWLIIGKKVMNNTSNMT